MNTIIETNSHCFGKEHLDLPDLMGSSSTLSLGSSASSTTSLYQCRKSNSNATFELATCSSYEKIATSAYNANKRSNAAATIQAAFRGFKARVQRLRAPLLAKLAEIQQRKQAELQTIETEKIAHMRAFQKELEFGATAENLTKNTRLVERLKAAKAKYEKKNAKLAHRCKKLKKSKKRMEMDAEMAAAKQRVADLERQQRARQEAVDKYLTNISFCEGRIQYADWAIDIEKRHTARLKECMAGILVRMECRCESISCELLDILYRNNAFL